MTTYYVRVGGSDSNAGTSAGAAWATVGKALGASGISSGDTVYIGPGLYREAVTVSMTAATVTTSVIGDVDGSHTGDPAGPVTMTANTLTDLATSSGTTLSMTSKHFLSFSNIVFDQSSGVLLTATTCHDITFTDCAFLANGLNAGGFSLTMTVDIASNWTIDRCIFTGYGGGNGAIFVPVLPTSTVADYDSNILIRNCIFYCFASAPAIQVQSSGANSFKGGGVQVRNCSAFGAALLYALGPTLSTTIPCTVKDSLVVSGSANAALRAASAGFITEDYNILIGSTIRTNVTAGTHSMGSTSPTVLPKLSWGQERIWGGLPRPGGTPLADSFMLGFGANASPPSVDMMNRARPGGAARVVTTGTFTAGGTATATNSGATFGGDKQLQGFTVKITGGTGSGQTMLIKSHTQTVLTVYGTWNTQPDNTSTYSIYSGHPAFYGKATSGGATSLTQSNATWDTNMWAGFTVETTAGTGSGQTNTVASNTATALTVNTTWGTNPDNTTVYKMYRQTSETAVLNAAGALERHDTASKETTLTAAGGVAWRLYGWAQQKIRIPVLTGRSVSIAVKCSFDTDHGDTNKPQAVLSADGETGVATQTVVATGTAGSGTFETLQFAAISPTASGWVEIELQARSDKITGRAVFDTLAVV